MKRHVIQCSKCGSYRKRGPLHREGPCRCGGLFVKRPPKPYAGRKMPPRVPAEVVEKMREMYEGGASLRDVGRAFPQKNGKARCGKSVGGLLRNRGVKLRWHPTMDARRVAGRGQFARVHDHSDAEIESLLLQMRRFALPAALKCEWRKWSTEKRRRVIGILRRKFPSSMPVGKIIGLAGAEFFDAASPLAREIAARENAGHTSRTAPVKLKLNSHGIAWNGRLWRWVENTGFLAGRFQKGQPAALLHWAAWARHQGRPVPAGCVIRSKSGNPLDFRACNLVLATRNDLARENHTGHLTKKSRELTALLLQRAQKTKTHEKDILDQLKAA